MLDTKLEENNGEKNNLRRTIDAIDGENNKVSYLANQKDNEEKLRHVQELYGQLIQNQEASKYFDAEVKFNVMIADINKIIGEAIKDVL